MLRRITLVLLCLAMLSGCWSRRELNDLLIVLGIAVDWQDGKYLVSYQVVNPNEIATKSNSTYRAPGILYQEAGNTLFEASRALTTRAPRLLYYGHLQLFVVSEEIARRGLSGVVDSTLRNNEARMDYNVVVARGVNAQDILKLYTPLEKLPTYSMQQSLQRSEKEWAPSVAVNMDKMLHLIKSDGQQLVLTGIVIKGDRKKADKRTNLDGFDPAAYYQYRGLGAFKGDRLIGWLNQKASKGYSDLTDILGSTSLELPCEDKHYTGIEITSSKTKIVPKLQDGKLSYKIKLMTTGDVVENSCNSINLVDPSVFPKLEQKAAVIIKENAEAAMKWAQDHHTDIIGLGIWTKRKYPKHWKGITEQWDDVGFPAAEISYEVKIKINTTGTIGNSISPDQKGG